MSSAGSDHDVGRSAEWDRLELSVRRLLDDYDRWRQRTRVAEDRIHELEAALKEVSGGELDPMELSARVERLRDENRDLRRRMEQAQARVRRIMARLRFIEEGG